MRTQRGLLVIMVTALLFGGLFVQPSGARAVGVWTAAAPMHGTGVVETATLLPTSQVLVAHSTYAVFASNTATIIAMEAYLPTDNSWATRASVPPQQGFQAPALLRDGRVLFTGGTYCPSTPSSCRKLDAAQIYDPGANTWTPVAPLLVARGQHTATTLRDGTVLVVGGDVGTGEGPMQATNVAERYDPVTNRWTSAGTLATARLFHTATLLPDGRVLIAGGSINDARGTLSGTITASAEVYDPATNAWTVVTSMPAARTNAAATVLRDGRVLVTGGVGGNPPAVEATAEFYDPVANTWTSAGQMTSPRIGHTATLLPTGQVLVTGGATVVPTPPSGGVTTATELYDPTRNVWAGAAPLTAPRRGHTATLLPDGRVLVAGGSTGTSMTRTADLYTATPLPNACFAETGKCVRGLFLAYWQAHGGLAVNGYPLSDEFIQILEDGKAYQVQYFERVRMEYHPENPPPYDVLLGQFGRRIHPADSPTTPIPGQVYFPETGHNLGGDFLTYWQANGGLAQFGFPISEVISEQLEDGKSYQVQYFERARFEEHPENQPPWNIELGQFGRRILAETMR